MKITLSHSEKLREFMTTPSENLVKFMKTLKGDITVLGGSGKMGPELVEMIIKADKQSNISRKIIVASTFSDPESKDWNLLQSLGVNTLKGDLSSQTFLKSIPDTKNVIYMMGFKFGSSIDWTKAFHMNCIVPYFIGEKYKGSNIVVFSSTNPYPHVKPENGGSKETDELQPQGIYAWCIVARESAFNTTAIKSPTQRLCFYRLAYAQHLAYGVIVDLARMIKNGEEISLSMPYVNLISQRDANECAIRALELCTNPATVLNVAGPITSVRYILTKLGELMGKKPKIIDSHSVPETALVANDDFCIKKFGTYRDSVDDMIKASAQWVMNNGEYWNKPTKFGQVQHTY